MESRWIAPTVLSLSLSRGIQLILLGGISFFFSRVLWCEKQQQQQQQQSVKGGSSGWPRAYLKSKIIRNTSCCCCAFHPPSSFLLSFLPPYHPPPCCLLYNRSSKRGFVSPAVVGQSSSAQLQHFFYSRGKTSRLLQSTINDLPLVLQNLFLTSPWCVFASFCKMSWAFERRKEI